MISRSRRDSVGGGVVAEFVRHLQKPTRFGGGGGSSSIFPGSPKADAIRWGEGGVVAAAIFRDLHFREVNSYPTFSDIRE